MSSVLAIDPGPVESGWCVVDSETCVSDLLTVAPACDNEGTAPRWWNTEGPLTHSSDSTREGLAMKATRPIDPPHDSGWSILGPGNKPYYVLAQCECGTVREVVKGQVKSGRSKSCGCRSGIGVAPAVRFWWYVAKTDECWNWTGGTTKGYGSFTDTNRRKVYAHRFSWELHRDPIPEGLVIDHLCRNTLCVNPDHLEPVTQQENVRRAVRKTS